MLSVTIFAAIAAVQPSAAETKLPEPATVVAATPDTLPLEAGEGRKVALELASQLESQFIIKANARDYGAMLRANAAQGRYDAGTRGAIAKMMTSDLLAVHKDGHLTVNVSKDEQHRNGPPPSFPPLIQSAKTIAPGIGYIRFTAFFGQPPEMARLNEWLDANRDAKVLIFDLRNHHGGGLAEQDAIFSRLFSERTPLVRMEMSKAIYDQHGAPTGEETETLKFAPDGDLVTATHYALPGADSPLRKAKVILLVSNRSASAAEHFALALKSTGRAVLIGEATAGANHFGGPSRLNDHFNVWMPIGRTSDLKTGQDWEGTGVTPDIAVDPRQALVIALKQAGLSHEVAVRLDAGEVPAQPVHSDKLRAR